MAQGVLDGRSKLWVAKRVVLELAESATGGQADVGLRRRNEILDAQQRAKAAYKPDDQRCTLAAVQGLRAELDVKGHLFHS